MAEVTERVQETTLDFAMEDEDFDKSLYKAYAHPPNPIDGHAPRPHELYRKPKADSIKLDQTWDFFYDGSGRPRRYTGFASIQDMPEVPVVHTLSYTLMGDRGPLVLLLHGVPTNKRQHQPVQKMIAPYCRTISIDMLGMGMSSKDVNWFNRNQTFGWAPTTRDLAATTQEDMNAEAAQSGKRKWGWWINDADYIHAIMRDLSMRGKFGPPKRDREGREIPEKFFFYSDDWGSGIAAHFAAEYNNRLLGSIYQNPIAFSGYFVKEIETIGQASLLQYNPEQNKATPWLDPFMAAMGSFAQTITMIYKQMVHYPERLNQYTLREIQRPYMDVDYERNGGRGGGDGSDVATPVTMKLDFDAIRVLSQRASTLMPAQLMPYDERRNPQGVKYQKITHPTFILWGDKDSMMPPSQRFKFKYAIRNATVRTQLIPDAGHFSAVDQPELVAEALLDFIIDVAGKDAMGDIFLGYRKDEIWHGAETQMHKELRKAYDVGGR